MTQPFPDRLIIGHAALSRAFRDENHVGAGYQQFSRPVDELPDRLVGTAGQRMHLVHHAGDDLGSGDPLDRGPENAGERVGLARGDLPLSGFDPVESLRVEPPAERAHLLRKVGLRHSRLLTEQADVRGDPLVNDAGREPLEFPAGYVVMVALLIVIWHAATLSTFR